MNLWNPSWSVSGGESVDSPSEVMFSCTSIHGSPNTIPPLAVDIHHVTYDQGLYVDYVRSHLQLSQAM